MIWYYLVKFLRALARLFIYPTPAAAAWREKCYRRDDKCLACGNFGCAIECRQNGDKLAVEQTCNTCGARVYRDVLEKDQEGKIRPKAEVSK